MGEKFKKILSEAKNNKKSKMLKKLHELDDKIDDFLEDLEDQIMSSEDESPVFVKKAQQLLANCTKEHSEFMSAIRAIVNAVDRKSKIVASFEKQESKVRDIRSVSVGDKEVEQEPVEDEQVKESRIKELLGK